jgi:hypothetical protein
MRGRKGDIYNEGDIGFDRANSVVAPVTGAETGLCCVSHARTKLNQETHGEGTAPDPDLAPPGPGELVFGAYIITGSFID